MAEENCRVIFNTCVAHMHVYMCIMYMYMYSVPHGDLIRLTCIGCCTHVHASVYHVTGLYR